MPPSISSNRPLAPVSVYSGEPLVQSIPEGAKAEQAALISADRKFPAPSHTNPQRGVLSGVFQALAERSAQTRRGEAGGPLSNRTRETGGGPARPAPTSAATRTFGTTANERRAVDFVYQACVGEAATGQPFGSLNADAQAVYIVLAGRILNEVIREQNFRTTPVATLLDSSVPEDILRSIPDGVPPRHVVAAVLIAYNQGNAGRVEEIYSASVASVSDPVPVPASDPNPAAAPAAPAAPPNFNSPRLVRLPRLAPAAEPVARPAARTVADDPAATTTAAPPPPPPPPPPAAAAPGSELRLSSAEQTRVNNLVRDITALDQFPSTMIEADRQAIAYRALRAVRRQTFLGRAEVEALVPTLRALGSVLNGISDASLAVMISQAWHLTHGHSAAMGNQAFVELRAHFIRAASTPSLAGSAPAPEAPALTDRAPGRRARPSTHMSPLELLRRRH